MRIGYFTSMYPRATDTFIQREVLGLRARGVDVRTFSVRKSSTDHDVGADLIKEKSNTYFILPVNILKLIVENLRIMISHPLLYISALNLAIRTRRPGLRGFVLQFFYFQEAVVFAKEIRHQGISHIHNHFGDSSGTVALLASRLSKIGYSMTIHGPHIFFDPTHWALKEKLRYSRFVVCISHYCLSQMMLFSDKSDWHRLQIVHCGVDVSHPIQPQIRQKAHKLLYSGRLAVEKGLPVLFESLSLLVERKYQFELTLLGDGDDRNMLELLGQKLNIEKRLVFVGFVDQTQVREYLEKSDIFILPSLAEGVPISLMEAMFFGVPVIGTSVGGVSELIESGNTGIIVPPAAPIELANAIARYIDDVELRKHVSKLGREKILTDFNLDKQLDELISLFSKCE
jgi:colanic acid/amylovoran biosynthesis glycosyltransferase